MKAFSTPIREGIRPAGMAREITLIIANVCHCDSAWTLHPEPMSCAEIDEVAERIKNYLVERLTESMKANNE